MRDLLNDGIHTLSRVLSLLGESLGLWHAPGLATVSAALSLIGWIPWSALISLDDLAYDIARLGGNTGLVACWSQFNSDAVMSTYLVIYVIGHLLSAVLIGLMLGRLGIVPAWAAWSFALTSPLTLLYFPMPTLPLAEMSMLLVGAPGRMRKGRREPPVTSRTKKLASLPATSQVWAVKPPLLFCS